MSWTECVAEIRGAAGKSGERYSDEDIERMLDRVVAEAKRRTGIGAPTADSLRAAATALADQERITAAIKKHNAAANVARRIARRQTQREAPDVYQGIMASIHAINTPTRDSQFSGEAMWKALSRQYIGGMLRDLENAKLFEAARSPAMDRLWGRELFELSKGDEGAPGVTGSAEALKIAQIVHQYQSMAKTHLNQAGAWIGDYMGYISRTEHHVDRLQWASGMGLRRGAADRDRAVWRDFVKPLLDEKTYDELGDKAGDLAARDLFLDRIYNSLVSGIHLTTEGMQGFKDPGFTGPGNLAKSLSQERVLHFLDGDSWMTYRERFGNPGTLIESVTRGLDRSARATGVMRKFGTNPQAEFDADIKFWYETLRDKDLHLADKIKAAGQPQGSLHNRMAFLTGEADRPANRLLAKLTSGLIAIENMAKLGAVGVGDLSGIATHAAELRFQGVGLLEGYGNALKSLVAGNPEIADQLLSHHEGMRAELIHAFNPDDTIPGTLSRMQNLFFKLTGTEYINRAERTGGEAMMARNLGRNLDKAHAVLPPEVSRLLRMFGIEEGEWEMLRSAAPFMSEDRAHLTPGMAMAIAPERVADYLVDKGMLETPDLDAAAMRRINETREDLATRLYALFNERSRYIMITSGIATKADLLQGTRPGTWAGSFARLVGQFKSWPAAMIRMGLGREIKGQDRAAAAAGLIHMAVASTVLGYGVMVLSDLAKGREPRDPLDYKTWLAAMARGGGVGILGDYLFGEYSRFGQSFVESALGPVLGQGANVFFDIFNRLKNGDDVSSTLYRFAMNNLPFVNLVYTRLMVDYMFSWQVQEALNPGAMRRFEQKVLQNNNQRFWISPSEAVGGSHSVHRPRQPRNEPWSWLR